MSLAAQSRLVAADRVYRPRDGLAVYVNDSRDGWVHIDVYEGTARRERVRMPRTVFMALFTNYSFNGGSDADFERAGDARPVAVEPGDGRGARPGDGLRGAVGVSGGVSS